MENKKAIVGEWMGEIEVLITDHVAHAPKWVFDSWGNRDRNDEYGLSFKYRHAKFRLLPNAIHPKGKPKCERFGGDDTDETILAAISKKYQNLKMKFVLPNPPLK